MAGWIYLRGSFLEGRGIFRRGEEGDWVVNERAMNE